MIQLRDKGLPAFGLVWHGARMATRTLSNRITTRTLSKADIADVWKAAAADATEAAAVLPSKTGWNRVIKERANTQTRHMETIHRFGSFRTYFRIRGSAIFHKSVVLRSLLASALAESAYYANRRDGLPRALLSSSSRWHLCLACAG